MPLVPGFCKNFGGARALFPRRCHYCLSRQNSGRTFRVCKVDVTWRRRRRGPQSNIAIRHDRLGTASWSDSAPPDIVKQVCAECPGRPLRSQCAHTTPGREYLKQQRVAHRDAPAPLPAAYRWLSPRRTRPIEPEPWATGGMQSFNPFTTPQYPQPSIPIDPAFSNGTTGTMTWNTIDESLNNPAAYNNIGMGSDATEPASSQTHREGPANVDTSDDESGGRAVAVIRTNGARTRVRISKRNPVYGVVEGAMRGANTFDIVRTKMLRPMITSRVEASARFLRSASEIIERCERLSNESGCWLYFSAQHLFATEPFLHYASPRILKEAKKDVEQITNHFNRVFHTLIAARNEDSKEMHKKLLAAQEKETTTQNALAASQSAEREATLTAATSQRQLELQAQEMEAQRLELEMWKARLKVAEQRRSDSSTS